MDSAPRCEECGEPVVAGGSDEAPPLCPTCAAPPGDPWCHGCGAPAQAPITDRWGRCGSCVARIDGRIRSARRFRVLGNLGVLVGLVTMAGGIMIPQQGLRLLGALVTGLSAASVMESRRRVTVQPTDLPFASGPQQ